MSDTHLTVAAVAAKLGTHEITILRAIAAKSDPLPASNISTGSRPLWRIDPSELAGWLRRRSTATRAAPTVQRTRRPTRAEAVPNYLGARRPRA